MNSQPLPDELTYGEAYGPAMEVTTAEEAAAYLERLVERDMRMDPTLTRAAAIHLEKSNIGYWTGYYDRKTAARVMALFNCEHPVFGRRTDVSAEEAFAKGRIMGEIIGMDREAQP